MPSIVVGTLRTLLTMDTASYEAGTRKAVASQGRLLDGTKKLTAASVQTSAAMQSLTSHLGRLASLAAIGAAITKTLDYAESLEKAAVALGTTSNAVQRLENIAVGSNTTIDAMTASIVMMQDRLASGDDSAIAAIKRLGLTVEQIFALEPDQQFILIAKALQQIHSQEQQIQLGKDIFGRGFVEIVGAARGEVDKLAESVTKLSKQEVADLLVAEQAWDNLWLAAKRYSGLVLAQAANPWGWHSARIGPFAPAIESDRPNAPGLPTQPAFGVRGPTPSEVRAIEAATAALQRRFEAAAQAASQWTANLTESYQRLMSEVRNAQGMAWFEHDADLARIHDYSAGLKGLLRTMQKIEQVDPPPWLPSSRVEGAMQIPGQGTRGEIGQGMISQQVSAKTTKAWSDMVENMTRTWGTLETAIQGSFAQILLRTRSFKEAMIDIWNSIKGALVNIFADIAAAYIKQMARMAAVKFGIGTALGVAGGTAAAAGTAAAVGGTAAAVGGTAAAAGGGTTAAATAGGIGLGTTIALTGGIAAGALLGWAIWKKGLFRGGEEALKVSPRRDKFLAQFGGPGTGEGSGFRRLADRLFALDHHEGLFTALRTSDRVKEFEAAQAAIVGRLGSAGQRVRSFALGGFVPPGMVVPAMLHGGAHGEVIMPLDKAGVGGTRVVNQYITVQGVIDRDNAVSFWREHILPQAKRALELNTDGYLTVHQRVRA